MARFVRYEKNGVAHYGELKGETIHPLDGEFGAFRASSDPTVRLDDVKLLAPCVPSKIIAVGPNCHTTLRLRDMPVPALGPGHAPRLAFPPDRPPSLHHLRRRSRIGLVRGFVGTTQPSDPSGLPERLRSIELPAQARDRHGGRGRPEVSQVPTRSVPA